MTENELFLYDIASKQITPLTKDFDPSVERVTWSQADALVYFSAEDRDYVNVFALNPKTGKISKVNIQGDYAYRFDVASQAPVLAYLSYRIVEELCEAEYGIQWCTDLMAHVLQEGALQRLCLKCLLRFDL